MVHPGSKSRHEALQRELEAVWREATVQDWDGYGAVPVSEETFRRALDFATSLPEHVPSPEVMAHPDGDIAFEWSVAPRWVLTVAIGPDDLLHYAGRFGRSRVHGAEEFSGAIPANLLTHLDRLYSMAPDPSVTHAR